MKKFIGLMMILLLMAPAMATSYDVVYYKDADGNGWFTNGGLYKEAKTNEVFKFVSETKDTIYLGFIDEGFMRVNDNFSLDFEE